MQVWWRDWPLTTQEKELWEALARAHYESSFRVNSSTVVVAQTAAGSGDLARSIAAGLLSLGGRHAPLEQTYLFLSASNPFEEVDLILARGEKVPGWGGSFQKGEPDPLWNEVRLCLRDHYPGMNTKLEEVTRHLAAHGKHLHPNPSAYTAAAAIIFSLPAKLASYLFISARLSAWAQIAARQF